MSVETWVLVPGDEDYEVSDHGRVRSWKRSQPQVLQPLVRQGGYLTLSLCREGRRRSVTVHALVALAFIGECPEGQEVRHLDGDPANNRLGNLAYGTHAENMQDRLRHGRHNMASKTACPSDHPYDEPDTYRYPDGRRGCRACARDRARAAYVPVGAA